MVLVRIKVIKVHCNLALELDNSIVLFYLLNPLSIFKLERNM